MVDLIVVNIMNSIMIIIPVYNELETIERVIEDLNNHGYKQIVVVDDGSTDKSYELLIKKKIDIIQHDKQYGQGAALRTGIKWALNKGADIIVTFDADGQHQAKELSKMIPLVNRFDVVLASRFIGLQTMSIPTNKKVVLKIGTVVLKLMYGINLTDSQNGLRVLSRKAAEQINITTNGMEHASEIIEEIAKNKLSFIEVPVDIKYTEYSIAKGQKWHNAFGLFFKMVHKKCK